MHKLKKPSLLFVPNFNILQNKFPDSSIAFRLPLILLSLVWTDIQIILFDPHLRVDSSVYQLRSFYGLNT